jgi:hypothetical protein
MEDIRFEAMMNGVVNGDRKMLYFSNERYLAIDSNTKPIELYNYASGSVLIKGHYTQNTSLGHIAQDHRLAINKAITAEMNKLILGKNTRGESFPLLNSSLKALAHGNSFDKLRSAYNTIQKLTMLSTDRALRMRVQEHVDKSFARSYTRLMSHEQQQRFVTYAVNKVNKIGVESQSDMINLCAEIDKISTSLPTLKNLGINFSDNVANVQYIVDARKVSGQLQETFERSVAEVLNRKNEEWNVARQISRDEGPVMEI